MEYSFRSWSLRSDSSLELQLGNSWACTSTSTEAWWTSFLLYLSPLDVKSDDTASPSLFVSWYIFGLSVFGADVERSWLFEFSASAVGGCALASAPLLLFPRRGSDVVVSGSGFHFDSIAEMLAPSLLMIIALLEWFDSRPDVLRFVSSFFSSWFSRLLPSTRAIPSLTARRCKPGLWRNFLSVLACGVFGVGISFDDPSFGISSGKNMLLKSNITPTVFALSLDPGFVWPLSVLSSTSLEGLLS